MIDINIKLAKLYDALSSRIDQVTEIALSKQVKGDKGDKGDQGDKGEKGDKGLDGKNGINGANGRNGSDGRNGADGKDGVDGADGEDGISIVDVDLEDNELKITMSDGSIIEAGEFDLPEAMSGVTISTSRNTSKLEWSDYAANWTAEPFSLGAVTGGEEFEYTYSNGTLYRFVPEPYVPSDDAFYLDQSMTTKIASRGIDI